jgi:hypothetical protein
MDWLEGKSNLQNYIELPEVLFEELKEAAKIFAINIEL